jgi:hypothetical protein
VRLIQRKFGLGMYPMIALWAVFSLASVHLLSTLGITGLHLLMEKAEVGPSYQRAIFWALLVWSVLRVFWNCNVYRRIDFLRLARNNGMTLLNAPSRIQIILTSWLRSMIRYRLDNMYVIAKIEGPYWSVFMFGESAEVTFEKLDSINKVGFASLVSIPITDIIDISIDYTRKEKELPLTGNSEIDEFLSEYREHLGDFRGTIRIERDHICVTVIGGAWFGKRFQKRIIKGLDIATKINETLGKKYQFNDWTGLEMKWDYNVKRFVLQREAERRLFS